MAEPADRRLLPDAITRKTFSNSFRGFDADEVRAFLVEIASAMREMEKREGDQRRRADSAEARALKAENLDEARLTAALGEETARVFGAAREAATEVRAKAEEAVARLLREARDEATKLRAEAEAMLATRSEEAEAAADQIRKKADDDAAHRRVEADHVLAAAREEAERIRKDANDEAERRRSEAREAADAEVEAAKETGRQLLAEAQSVRERVLRDLSKKRKVARQQLEQLRAGRERLLEALEVVKEASVDATRELVVALPEARAAAEAAARRVDDDEPTIEQLEAELAAGRAAGLPIIDPDADHDEEPSAAEVVAEVLAEAPDVAAAVIAEPTLEREPEPEPTRPEDRGPVFDPAPTPPPEPLPSAVRGERKSSALRVFRTRRSSVADELPVEDMPTLAPSAPFEHVRIVDAEPAAAAIADESAEPVVAADPDPAVALVDEPAAEPDVAQPAETAAASDVPAVAELTTDGGGSDDVTDLFARLRANEPATDFPRIRMEPVASSEEAEVAAAPTDEPATDSPQVRVESVASSEEVAPIAPAVPAPETETESLLEQRDAITDDVEQRLAKRLKRVLADEQNAVLDALRRNRKATLFDLLASPEMQAAPYVESAVVELRQVAAAGVGFFASNGTSSDVEVDDLAADLAAAITGPLRDRVERALRDGGGDEETTADGIRSSYREWKTQKIGDAARHFVIAAFTRGAYSGLPEGSTVCWLVDSAGVACPDAEDNALAGALVKGSAFPTGHTYPPAHPGCRCLVVPGSQ